MKKSRVILFFIGLLLLILAVLPELLRYVAIESLLRLRDRGIAVSHRELEGHLVGLSASELQVMLPVASPSGRGAIPVSVELQNANISLSVSLFPPRLPFISFSALTYDGSLRGELPIRLTPTLSISLENARLDLHPQLRALGVNAGSLSVAGSDLPLNRDKLTTGTLKVSLRDADVTALPMVTQLTRIERLQRVRFDGEAAITPEGSFAVAPFRFESSLANAIGDAKGVLRSGGKPFSLQGTLRFTLSKPDGESLRQWLPLLTNNRVDSSQDGFSVTLRSASCTGRAPGMLKISDACIQAIAAP